MTKRWLGIGGVAVGAIAVAVGVAVSSASCSQTPTNVPVRSLQQSQKVDVVCLNMLPEDGGPGVINPAIPLDQSQCAPVAANVNGAALPNHLFAAVTQTTRGELALVDLTAGQVVDEDRSTPGINFIPVGAAPTDVAITSDGKMTFVSSAADNKPAIYGIPSKRMLGDYVGGPPLQLTDLQACLLPQPPQALAISYGPGGEPVLLALLRGSETLSTDAVIVSVDPSPITPPDSRSGDGGSDAEVEGGTPPPPRGTFAACRLLGQTKLSPDLPATWSPGPAWPDGVPYADAGAIAEPTPIGSCGEGGASGGGFADAGETGDAALPLSFGTLDRPRPTAMVLRDDVPLLYVADNAIPVIHVIDVSDSAAPHEVAPLLATSLLDPARRVVVGPLALSPPTSDFKRYLYATDTRDNSIMVFDVTDPVASPHVPLQHPHADLNPFVEPDRIVFSAPIASVAFVQHDWPLPSQNPSEPKPPIHQYTGILCNPNQNAHPDAGAFADPGAFYRVDQAGLIQPSGARESFPTRLRGVFAFVTLSNGLMVLVDVDDWDAPCRRPDPMSATPVTDLADASSGSQTGLLDIPQPPPGASPDAGEFDPYHTPIAYNPAINESAAVTLESFFPVSAPHRPRSTALLLNDPISGVHVPYLPAVPALYDVNGAPLSTTGNDGVARPKLLPTLLPPSWVDYSYAQNPTEPNPGQRVFVDTTADLRRPLSTGSCSFPPELVPESELPLASPDGGTDGGQDAGGFAVFASNPSVRLSFDDPTAHQDQDWTVAYEGVLPTVSGVVADMVLDPEDNGQTMWLYANGARFCRRGVEDANIGQQRVAQVERELGLVGLPQEPTDRAQWTTDYIEITDDLLSSDDGYWSLGDAGALVSPGSGGGPDGGDASPPVDASPAVENNCWEGDLASASASDRYNLCLQTFGTAANADSYLSRDYPILEAHDDFLKVGRFGWVNRDPKNNAIPESTTNRVIVASSESNRTYLNLAQCCFHHQIGFKVRAGGEWLTVGNNGIGMLGHVRADSSGRCVPWADPRLSLLNSRAFDIPWSTPESNCTPPPLGVPRPFFRDSPLAMRNPMFSFVMWSGCGQPPGYNDHTLSQRDEVWRFSVRGGFSPISISLAQGATTAVSPQSMRFIASLGQLAVVDGEAQGLVLIDLNTIGFAHTPFF
jgi:hypothetical protein